MDTSKLSDYLALMKYQLDAQQMLLEYHLKIEAMIEMLLFKDVIDCPRLILHQYLCAISDLIRDAKTLNEELLDRLIKITAYLPKFKDLASNEP